MSRILTIFLCLAVSGLNLEAQETLRSRLEGESTAAASTATNSIPTKIFASRALAEWKENRVTFIGNVHVVDPQMDIRGDKMVIHYVNKTNAPSSGGVFVQETRRTPEPSASPSNEGQDGNSASSLDRIIITGNVEIILTEKGITSHSQQATYLAREELIILEGDPVAYQGPNKSRSDVLRINLKTGEVEGDGSVEIELMPEKREQGPSINLFGK